MRRRPGQLHLHGTRRPEHVDRGTKIEGDYTGTFSLNTRERWCAQANVHGTIGNVTYDGWCSPFFIAPNSSSPNGYELDLGDASPCSESGDKDRYVEARALVGAYEPFNVTNELGVRLGFHF